MWSYTCSNLHKQYKCITWNNETFSCLEILVVNKCWHCKKQFEFWIVIPDKFRKNSAIFMKFVWVTQIYKTKYTRVCVGAFARPVKVKQKGKFKNLCSYLLIVLIWFWFDQFTLTFFSSVTATSVGPSPQNFLYCILITY